MPKGQVLATFLSNPKIEENQKLKRYFAYFLGLMFIGLGAWIIRNFGTVTLDQVIFHLVFGGQSLLTVDKEIVLNFLKLVVAGPAVVAAIFSLVDSGFSRIFIRFARGNFTNAAINKKIKSKYFS